MYYKQCKNCHKAELAGRCTNQECIAFQAPAFLSFSKGLEFPSNKCVVCASDLISDWRRRKTETISVCINPLCNSGLHKGYLDRCYQCYRDMEHKYPIDKMKWCLNDACPLVRMANWERQSNHGRIHEPPNGKGTVFTDSADSTDSTDSILFKCLKVDCDGVLTSLVCEGLNTTGLFECSNMPKKHVYDLIELKDHPIFLTDCDYYFTAAAPPAFSLPFFAVGGASAAEVPAVAAPAVAASAVAASAVAASAVGGASAVTVSAVAASAAAASAFSVAPDAAHASSVIANVCDEPGCNSPIFLGKCTSPCCPKFEYLAVKMLGGLKTLDHSDEPWLRIFRQLLDPQNVRPWGINTPNGDRQRPQVFYRKHTYEEANTWGWHDGIDFDEDGSYKVKGWWPRYPIPATCGEARVPRMGVSTIKKTPATLISLGGTRTFLYESKGRHAVTTGLIVAVDPKKCNRCFPANSRTVDKPWKSDCTPANSGFEGIELRDLAVKCHLDWERGVRGDQNEILPKLDQGCIRGVMQSYSNPEKPQQADESFLEALFRVTQVRHYFKLTVPIIVNPECATQYPTIGYKVMQWSEVDDSLRRIFPDYTVSAQQRTKKVVVNSYDANKAGRWDKGKAGIAWMVSFLNNLGIHKHAPDTYEFRCLLARIYVEKLEALQKERMKAKLIRDDLLAMEECCGPETTKVPDAHSPGMARSLIAAYLEPTTYQQIKAYQTPTEKFIEEARLLTGEVIRYGESQDPTLEREIIIKVRGLTKSSKDPSVHLNKEIVISLAVRSGSGSIVSALLETDYHINFDIVTLFNYCLVTHVMYVRTSGLAHRGVCERGFRALLSFQPYILSSRLVLSCRVFSHLLENALQGQRCRGQDMKFFTRSLFSCDFPDYFRCFSLYNFSGYFFNITNKALWLCGSRFEDTEEKFETSGAYQMFSAVLLGFIGELVPSTAPPAVQLGVLKQLIISMQKSTDNRVLRDLIHKYSTEEVLSLERMELSTFEVNKWCIDLTSMDVLEILFKKFYCYPRLKDEVFSSIAIFSKNGKAISACDSTGSNILFTLNMVPDSVLQDPESAGGLVELIQLCRREGLDVNTKNKMGKTALECFVEHLPQTVSVTNQYCPRKGGLVPISSFSRFAALVRVFVNSGVNLTEMNYDYIEGAAKQLNASTTTIVQSLQAVGIDTRNIPSKYVMSSADEGHPAKKPRL